MSMGPDLAALARFHGIEATYRDVEGRQQDADADVVVALLQALGVPVSSPAGAGKILREQQEAARRRLLEPVLVHWMERPAPVFATLPATVEPDDLWVSLELENGEVRRASVAVASSGTAGTRRAGSAGPRVQVPLDLNVVVGGVIPAGRHHLTLEGAGAPETALLLSAPTCPASPRWLGAFMPVHAIRTEHDWGIGTYGDLEVLGEWLSECGVDVLGTLPLYPAYLATPSADPSPYLPVSRLAYNEVFVDPVALPEFSSCPDARTRWASSERRIAALRSSPLVPYEDVAALLREVLEPMARCAVEGRLPERQAGLQAFARANPELENYAEFRARGEQREHESSAPDPSVTAYYLYGQWAAQEQLAAATRSCPHYADLPVGSHPRGFDPVWSPVSFVPGVDGGAPPDRFFPLGQNWGFHPLHPERIREDEYRFVSAAPGPLLPPCRVRPHRPRHGPAAVVHDPRRRGRGSLRLATRSRNCMRWSRSRPSDTARWWSARTSGRCPRTSGHGWRETVSCAPGCSSSRRPRPARCPTLRRWRWPPSRRTSPALRRLPVGRRRVGARGARSDHGS